MVIVFIPARGFTTSAEGSEFKAACEGDFFTLSVLLAWNGYLSLIRASTSSNSHFPSSPLAEGQPLPLNDFFQCVHM